MPKYEGAKYQPFVSLIYLLMLIVAGSVIFTILAFGIGMFAFEPKGIAFISSGFQSNISFLKLVQITSTVGTFIVPAFVYARIESIKPLNFLGLKKSVNLLIPILAIAVMFTCEPFLEAIIELNKAMHLPSFLSGLEQWMKNKEDELGQLTIELLTMKTVGAFIINLLMIAILPAIGEELIFRGCLQRLISRWSKNKHIGVWLAAIIFSAIHLQFYGFFPRMLLGALLGYLYVWTGNLWISILAHFVNNASAVIAAYFYQQNGQSLEKLNESSPSSLFAYLASFVLTAFLLIIIYRVSNLHQLQEEKI